MNLAEVYCASASQFIAWIFFFVVDIVCFFVLIMLEIPDHASLQYVNIFIKKQVKIKVCVSPLNE